MWTETRKALVVVLAVVFVFQFCLAVKAEDAKFIGNKTSKTYHKPDCASVKNMKDENKVYFESEEDAKKEGYTPCKKCMAVKEKKKDEGEKK